MSISCKSVKEVLIDIIYDEDEANEKIIDHLKECEECKEYYNQLNSCLDFDEVLNNNDIEIDNSIINNAFVKVKNIRNTKKFALDLFLFIIIATCFISTIIYLFTSYLNIILYSQVILAFLVPLILPLIIKYRIKKEGYNEI